MRKAITLLLYLAASALHAAYLPTPEMAMSIPFAEDDVKWPMQFIDGNKNKIIAESTPAGQSIEAWKEMLSQEITFTKKALSKHLSDWAKMITQSDPNVAVKELNRNEDRVTLSYRPEAFNEYSVRIFLKAKDGVYAQAYHIKLNTFNESRANLWAELISKTKLSPNPQKSN